MAAIGSVTVPVYIDVRMSERFYVETYDEYERTNRWLHPMKRMRLRWQWRMALDLMMLAVQEAYGR